jgi:hypothetical protein
VLAKVLTCAVVGLGGALVESWAIAGGGRRDQTDVRDKSIHTKFPIGGFATGPLYVCLD